MTSIFTYVLLIIFGIPLIFLIGFLLNYILFRGYIYAFTGKTLNFKGNISLLINLILGIIYAALLFFYKQLEEIRFPFEFVYFFFGTIGLYYLLSLFVDGPDRLETLQRSVFATFIILIFWI